MNRSKSDIELQINILERAKIGYLEVDNKAGARRKEKQIEVLRNELELIDLREDKQILKIYMKFIKEKNLKEEFDRFMIAELAK